MATRPNIGTQTIFASAARTATATSSVYRKQGDSYRGILLQIDCTASAATPSVVFGVEYWDGAAWTAHMESAAVTDVATVNMVIHPDAVDIANLSESTALPTHWRVVATHADGDSITYSVKAWPLK